MSQNTGLLQNRYRLRTVLGTGGFSTIYLADDQVTGAEVSIKEFTAEHMDGLSTILCDNAYDIASRSEPQPVPDASPPHHGVRLDRHGIGDDSADSDHFPRECVLLYGETGYKVLFSRV